mmetsp:Transcript_36321/g.82617  ORF Transcript_36321/g.82617 Transcript_36321/m.82617 type:complete len:253 (+) Transcript_36321:350-1108(+)
MSSVNSWFSFLRCSVASATALSKALMPAVKAAASSFSVAIESEVFAMAVSESAMARSRPFFLSSDSSNCTPQYSFLWSSSDCSVLRLATISSIMVITFSKPIFLPRNAKRIRSKRVRSCWAPRASRSIVVALVRNRDAPSWTCTRLTAGLGRVFLNSSRASSSLSTLMVSARAASSSALVFTRSSHSAVLVAQLFSKLALNSLSAIRASSVSPRSFFICAMDTPNSPDLCKELSIFAISTWTSFFLAAISSS